MRQEVPAHHQVPQQQSATLAATHFAAFNNPCHFKEILEQRQKQLINHVEYHSLITEKYNLLHVLQRFSEQQKENLWDMIPVTFYIEMSDPTVSTVYQQSMLHFTQFWQTMEQHRSQIRSMTA
jgi:hypothetical protein